MAKDSFLSVHESQFSNHIRINILLKYIYKHNNTLNVVVFSLFYASVTFEFGCKLLLSIENFFSLGISWIMSSILEIALKKIAAEIRYSLLYTDISFWFKLLFHYWNRIFRNSLKNRKKKKKYCISFHSLQFYMSVMFEFV